MENLLESCGYNVNDVLPITSEIPDVNEKNIQQHQFDRLMFITNGNPRYMCDFLSLESFWKYAVRDSRVTVLPLNYYPELLQV